MALYRRLAPPRPPRARQTGAETHEALQADSRQAARPSCSGGRRADLGRRLRSRFAVTVMRRVAAAKPLLVAMIAAGGACRSTPKERLWQVVRVPGAQSCAVT